MYVKCINTIFDVLMIYEVYYMTADSHYSLKPLNTLNVNNLEIRYKHCCNLVRVKLSVNENGIILCNEFAHST